MEKNFDIVVFNVRRDADGLFTATSPHLAGVCVVHRDRDRIIEDMPNIVRLWYRKNRGVEVEPFWGTSRDFDGTSAFPMFTVPAEIAARALAG
jgi:hypothetical protein